MSAFFPKENGSRGDLPQVTPASPHEGLVGKCPLIRSSAHLPERDWKPETCLTSRRSVASLGFVGNALRRAGSQRLEGSRPGQCEVDLQWCARDAIRFPTPLSSSLTPSHRRGVRRA